MFLWERGASVGADFDLLNCQDLPHALERLKHTGEPVKKTKSIIGAL